MEELRPVFKIIIDMKVIKKKNQSESTFGKTFGKRCACLPMRSTDSAVS